MDNSGLSLRELQVMLILRKTFEFLYLTVVKLMVVKSFPSPVCFCRFLENQSQCFQIVVSVMFYWYHRYPDHLLPHF